MQIKARWFPVFTFFLGLALTASAAIPAVEKILPDDTLVLVTTPDFAKARQTYRSSPQTQLWDDPAMKPFKDKFLSKLNEDLIQPLEKDLGVKLDDYTNLPQGQITFAITQNGWPTTEQLRRSSWMGTTFPMWQAIFARFALGSPNRMAAEK